MVTGPGSRLGSQQRIQPVQRPLCRKNDTSEERALWQLWENGCKVKAKDVKVHLCCTFTFIFLFYMCILRCLILFVTCMTWITENPFDGWNLKIHDMI